MRTPEPSELSPTKENHPNQERENRLNLLEDTKPMPRKSTAKPVEPARKLTAVQPSPRKVTVMLVHQLHDFRKCECWGLGAGNRGNGGAR